jgi:hypothetical protein
MAYINMENQLANILTKGLPHDHFECLHNLIGMNIIIDVSMNGSFGVNVSTSTPVIQIIPPCK